MGHADMVWHRMWHHMPPYINNVMIRKWLQSEEVAAIFAYYGLIPSMMTYSADVSVLFPVSVSPLLPVFGFLTCRAAAVRTGYVFLLLGFGLHLAVILGSGAFLFEYKSASAYYVINLVAHSEKCFLINDGTVSLL